MTGFTLITLLTLLNGDATPMSEMRAFVDAVAKRPLSVEAERLRQFWCDYQKAVREYEASNIDWVQYYKMGSHINTQGGIPVPGNNRVMVAPVYVSPQMQWAVPTQMQWAVPNSTLTGAPNGPGGIPPQVYEHMRMYRY